MPQEADLNTKDWPSLACTCLRLRKLTRRVTQLYDQIMEPCGLTGQQFGLLSNLRRNPGISVGDLAVILAMDPTTLTRLLRPLEQKGFVAIVAPKEDRRRRVLKLTDVGLDALKAAYPLWKQAQLGLAEKLGPEDYAAFQSSLDHALDHFTQLA